MIFLRIVAGFDTFLRIAFVFAVGTGAAFMALYLSSEGRRFEVALFTALAARAAYILARWPR